MKICKKCLKEFKANVKIDGKNRSLGSRQYCLDCSPFGSHNTKSLLKLLNSSEQKCVCKYCKLQYPWTKESRAKGYRKETCRSCNIQRTQRRKKEFAVQQFGGKCSRCGYSKCMAALEFHHISEKAEHASYVILRWSWEKAKKELEKCILLCSNCHKEAHFKEKDISYAKRKTLPIINKICLFCNTGFETKSQDQKYCCKECRINSKKGSKL